MQGNPIPPKPRNVPLIVCGVAACGCLFGFIPFMAAIMLPVFSQARGKAQEASCMSNEKQQTLAGLMYIEDYDGTLPRSAHWMDDLVPYIKNDFVFHCPAISLGKITPDCGYAFDSRLSGAEMADIETPEASALIFESTDLRRNASDAGKSLPQGEHLRHNSDNIAFLDGHAKAFRSLFIDDEITALSKNPVTPKAKKASKNAGKVPHG